MLLLAWRRGTRSGDIAPCGVETIGGFSADEVVDPARLAGRSQASAGLRRSGRQDAASHSLSGCRRVMPCLAAEASSDKQIAARSASEDARWQYAWRAPRTIWAWTIVRTPPFVAVQRGL
jgi:hypothetical protein